MKEIESSRARELVREAESLSTEQRRALTYKRLRELVFYAKENSPYLARLYRDIGENFELSELPVTQKSELQKHFDEWVTDREVKGDELRRYLKSDACEKNATPFLSKYTFVSTSGTTGTPFTILRDDYHNKIHGALLSERFLKVVGSSAISPETNRIASIIVTDPHVSSYGSFLRTKRAAGEYEKNMMAISTVQSLAYINDALNEFQPAALTGYPSVLTMLADEQLAGRLNISIKVVICSGELLSHDAYMNIRRAFGCPVLNNYCMTEGGEVAFANGLCENLHINDDWVIIEPIDADGNPAKPGEMSDAILVSDLSNYICPIIRYRVDDRVMVESDGCVCASPLPILKIAGREMPFMSLCGRRFAPVGLYSMLEKTPEMIKFQIARVEEDMLEIRLHTKGGASFECAKSWVEFHTKEFFRQSGFSDARFRVIDRLPENDSKSGKFKIIVDEVK